jgi:hypothetical protein
MAEMTPAAPPGPGPEEKVELPPAALEPGESYQSLSLLALFGFVLSACCAAMVLLGGLIPLSADRPVAFWGALILFPIVGAGIAGTSRQSASSSKLWIGTGLGLAVWAGLLGIGGLVLTAGTSPWVLGGMFWALAAAGLVTSLIARYQISASEGTLTGEWLTRWGVITTLFIALIYAAYLSSIHLAQGSQARAAALEYMSLLQKGDILQAYIRTLGVAQPPQGGVTLAMVEARNTPGARNLGPYTSYERSDHVRMMRLSGESAKLTEKAFAMDLSGKHTEVTAVYGVSGPYFEFDMTIQLEGREVTVGSVRRRLWTIQEKGTGAVGAAAMPRLTEEGNPLGSTYSGARTVTERFLAAVNKGRLDEAFLMTLPPAERAEGLMSPKRKEFPSEAFLGLSGAYAAEEKLRAIARTSLTSILKGVKDGLQFKLSSAPDVTFPLFRATEGRVVYEVDTQLTFGNPARSVPPTMVIGYLHVEGPFETRKVEPEEFRVVGFIWKRVKQVQPGAGAGE